MKENDFCAGIVSYQPDLARLEENLKHIAHQVSKVYIVDNLSSRIDRIQELTTAAGNAELIRNDHNNGIAKALNQMCAKAIEDGYSWILTLDQDTVVPDNLMETLIRHTDDLQIGIVCPGVIYEGQSMETSGTEQVEYVYACMTSASLTRLEAWKKTGGFREDYFIDFVDNEFCMKLSLNGYKVLRDNTCRMSHQLGETGVKKILGLFPYRYARHSPKRVYYMARNNAAFIREYKENLPVPKEKLKLIYVLWNEWLAAENRHETWKCIWQGLKDAKEGKMGEYER